jgi:hypothetical protein
MPIAAQSPVKPMLAVGAWLGKSQAYAAIASCWNSRQNNITMTQRAL